MILVKGAGVATEFTRQGVSWQGSKDCSSINIATLPEPSREDRAAAFSWYQSSVSEQRVPLDPSSRLGFVPDHKSRVGRLPGEETRHVPYSAWLKSWR